MISARVFLLVGVAFIFLFSSLAYAEVPQMINYQGKITTPAGALVDTTVGMVFTIYDAPTDGGVLWTETQPSVVVEKGVFSVLLGSINLIPDSVFTGAVRYLGVKVGADPEMAPRKEMVSVAYAYTDGDWTVSGDSVYRLSGNVGIGEIPPGDVKLYVKTEPPPGDWMYGVYAEAGMGVKGVSNAISGTGISGVGGHCGVDGSGGYIGILGQGVYGGWFEGNGYFSGKLGIGTTAPDEELHVQGNIKMVDGNQAAGKVLTSDANGVGTWQAAAGGIGGSGTANYVPKFTASTTLGNSAIYETGSRIGIGTTTPSASSKLHVQHNNLYAGYFTSNYSSSSTKVIYSQFTGSGNYNATAVYGYSKPADGWGYGGYFEGGRYGVSGQVRPSGSQFYYGVEGRATGGSGQNYGLLGQATGTGTNYGVWAYAGNGTTNWAGYFAGNARVTGTLTKGGGSFQIDHPLDPENKYLFHSFVESPDMKNVYDGVVTLDGSGEATVQLPAYFEALNRDFRYQLTAIGSPGPNLYIAAKIGNNQFTIAGGKPGMEVSWQVTGIRHDKFAEANRIQVEVDKPDNERGKYLHPKAYNLGEEYDIHYEQHKRTEERETREMK